MALALVVSVLLTFFPHLDDWPRAEPDETHHLIVEKNVVELGRYASGKAAVGYRDFDPFDSVGPEGILPAAASRAATTSSTVVSISK